MEQQGAGRMMSSWSILRASVHVELEASLWVGVEDMGKDRVGVVSCAGPGRGVHRGVVIIRFLFLVWAVSLGVVV